MGRFVEGADRSQLCFLPECLEDWVDEDNPVHVIEAFVEALDLPALGFDGATPANTGRPAYHPAVLLKLYIYGYLNRVQSSRGSSAKPDATSKPDGLLGRLVPDHKTIADFRKDNGRALRQPVLACCALPPMGLPAGGTVGGAGAPRRSTTATGTSPTPRWPVVSRRSRKASRATCISSTAPTGRSRARRSPPRRRGSRKRSADSGRRWTGSRRSTG